MTSTADIVRNNNTGEYYIGNIYKDRKDDWNLDEYHYNVFNKPKPK